MALTSEKGTKLPRHVGTRPQPITRLLLLVFQRKRSELDSAGRHRARPLGLSCCISVRDQGRPLH